MTLMTRINEHYAESLKYFKKDQIVGLFCQGSQNYAPYKSMTPEENPEARELLEDVSYNIMKIAVEGELNV